MEKVEMVFIPLPTSGHMVPMVELAKLLTTRSKNLSISIFLLKLELDVKAFNYVVQSKTDADVSDIRFVEIPVSESDFSSKSNPGNNKNSPFTILIKLIEDKKIQIRDAVSEMCSSSNGRNRIAGFVLDMFCSSMIDVANEFQVPTYFFYTSSAALISLRFHVLSLVDDYNQDIEEYMDSDDHGVRLSVNVPGYNHPVPVKLWPSSFFDKSGMILNHTRRFREAKGILVNTFMDLEFPIMEVLSRDEDKRIPKVYPVGPIINSKGFDKGGDFIMKWLDDQPPLSVIFLCFGSLGSFENEQVKEIAKGVENSGYKFLWSLRQPSPKGFREYPDEYEEDHLEDVLPEGFLQRTARMGMVLGWAPQVQVLSHSAVGGFVSHCGWNSTLESVFHGVPIAAWPVYAEQQMNAFQMVKETGIAVEIKMDYRKDMTVENPVLVMADEIEDGIRKVMEPESDSRKKVQALKIKARISLMEGGSSFTSLGNFLEDVFSI